MSVSETQEEATFQQPYEDFFAGKKHSKIQYDPEVNQWTIKVLNNPNITASSYASINTKAIGNRQSNDPKNKLTLSGVHEWSVSGDLKCSSKDQVLQFV